MRLIYEDALIEDLKKWKGLNNKTIEAVLETINKQPTAYDPEKVVEEVKDYRDLVTGCYLREIIEIVRKGGVE